MSAPTESLRRVAVATRLLFKDLLRRRLTLLLLFVVPALFDGIVLVTTASREVEITIGSLVEPGAEIHLPGTKRDPFDLGLYDDGSRMCDERALSLTFLGGTAVAFLACFLAFYLVHKRTEADARLVQAGFRSAEVLAAKLLCLTLLVAALAVYETAIIRPYLAPKQPELLAGGFFLAGLVYGALGLSLGAIVEHELEGVFGIVLFTNVDAGWLQNPLYYASSERRGLIEALPGYGPAQLALHGAFTEVRPAGLVAQSLLWAGGLLALAMVAFWLRIRPAPDAITESAHLRRHYLKVMLVTYVLWNVGYQLVGRYASTLPTVDLTSSWDRAIPLVPAFVWPYEACYLLPFITPFVIRDFRRFNVAVLAILISNLTAFVFYLLLPVAFPRPELGDTLSERLLAFEYAADFVPGANNLPSMHVALVCMLSLAMWGQRSRVFDAFLVGFVLLVAASTTLVKQHLIIDVVTGFVWAIVPWLAAKWIYRKRTDSDADAEEGLAQLFRP
jgi:membrane-associated phospholipid phosphatase